MSIPKSKMISASKALLALAAKAKYQQDESVRAIQNQTVTVNVQQHSPATVITNTASRKPTAEEPQPSSFHEEPTVTAAVEDPLPPARYSDPPVVERDIVLEPSCDVDAKGHYSGDEPIPNNFYEEVEALHAMVNNYETVAKALILIIELLQSNPLKLNKIIVPTEPAFKELIAVLTAAEDVEIRYSEDISCGISSKKYRVIEDIIVVKNQEPKSLKYSYPDVIRLFDKFDISIKMIAKIK